MACALMLAGNTARAAEADTKRDDRPNVVLIISDDQGWTDYGFMGHESIRTPHLDRLSRRSLLFEWGYVVSPLCRPSLASMATGLYPHQHEIVANDVNPKRRAASDKPVQAHFRQLPTIMTRLVDAGYLAHQSGKWWEGKATEAGFTHGMTHGDPRRGGRHGDHGLRIGRKTMKPIKDFIDHATERDRPFFLWYAPFMPHTPHNPPQKYLDKYRAPDRPHNVAKYYAMCEWFDHTCGQLLGHIEKRGLDENTIVVFIADNGWAPRDRSADPPKGWWNNFAPRSKGSPFERGIRTPIMIAWPNHIGPKRSEDLASSIDLMPTILRACGVKPPDDLPGIDLLDAEARRNRDAVFGAAYSIHNMNFGDPASTLQYRWCVTADKWKLILRSHGEDTTRYRHVHKWDTTPARLYHLHQDPHERENLAHQRPDRVDRLSERIKQNIPGP